MAAPAYRNGHLFGEYRVEGFLGKGGFAEVYRCKHSKLGNTVAIKVLTAQLTDEDEKKFIKEARLLVQLRHPNIVPLLHFSTSEGTPYLVMEYAPGKTLRDLHPLGTRVPLEQVVLYTRQVAAALAHAHAHIDPDTQRPQPIIHRDVKPQNMLIGPNREIWLSDFGIAVVRSVDYRNTTDTVRGTLKYIAPEQFKSLTLPASDQYSLAVVIYEWLTGEAPFKGTEPELIKQLLEAPPPPLRARGYNVPEGVEYALMLALSKDPTDRFKNIVAFANAVEQSSKQVAQAGPRPFINVPPDPRPVSQPTLTPPSAVTPTPTPTPTPIPQPATGPLQPVGTLHSLYNEHTSKVTALVWVGNGQQEIASFGEDHILHIWDVNTRQRTSTYPNKALGVGTMLLSLHWSPDNKRFASLWSNGQVEVWDIASRSRVCLYQAHKVKGLAWSPGGEQIASFGGDRAVYVWNATTGTELASFSVHGTPVSAVIWSSEGRRVVSAEEAGLVQVWEVGNRPQVLSTYEGHREKVTQLWWIDVPGRQGVVVSREAKDPQQNAKDQIRVWEASSSRRLWSYEDQLGPVSAVAQDGRGLVWRNAQNPTYAQVLLIDANPPQLANGQPAPSYRLHLEDMEVLAWKPQTRFIASGSADSEVRVWDGETGKIFYRYQRHNAPVTALAWSPNGERLASADANGQVRVWQASGEIPEELRPPPFPDPTPQQPLGQWQFGQPQGSSQPYGQPQPMGPFGQPQGQGGSQPYGQPQQPGQGTTILPQSILPEFNGNIGNMGNMPGNGGTQTWDINQMRQDQTPRGATKPHHKTPTKKLDKMRARGERATLGMKTLAAVDVFVAPLLAGLFFNSALLWFGLMVLGFVGCVLALLRKESRGSGWLVSVVMALFALLWAAVGVTAGGFFVAGHLVRIGVSVVLGIVGIAVGVAHGFIVEKGLK